MITGNNLVELYGCSQERADKFVVPINQTLDMYDINNVNRISAFLAQIGHESGRLRYVKELWGPTPAQKKYDQKNGNKKPEAIRIAARHGSTPGRWFMGRGLIQITGYDNYLACGEGLGLDLINHPELLEQPMYAAMCSGWYWDKHNLNELADEELLRQITRIINGGYNGWQDRLALYDKALSIFT